MSVPFFASEHVSANGTGRGERLEAAVPMPLALLLVIPRFSIATADAYRWLDESREGTGEAVSGASVGGSGNDFEAVVEARHPELRDYRERLSALGARIARLSGSGSTVFGAYEGSVPDPKGIAGNPRVVATRTSSRVVQVEVLK